MHDAVRGMLERYSCSTRDDYINALREILQEVALLGMWRSKFFEHAAFYGGSALRILHALDRFSEDMDFSLLKPDPSFSMKSRGEALKREIRSFGFDMNFHPLRRTERSTIESAFLKGNTLTNLLEIKAPEELLRDMHANTLLKIKLEVDIDPPGGFKTETQYVLQPIPFAVRSYSLPDLFAGKIHAVLCRKWRNRVKGRDWYDMVWYIGQHPEIRLSHLEARMRQTGHYTEEGKLTLEILRELLLNAVEGLDVEQAREEVTPFVRDPRGLEIWSKEFFSRIIERIVPVDEIFV